jgi:hypothetical protein
MNCLLHSPRTGFKPAATIPAGFLLSCVRTENADHRRLERLAMLSFVFKAF